MGRIDESGAIVNVIGCIGGRKMQECMMADMVIER